MRFFGLRLSIPIQSTRRSSSLVPALFLIHIHWLANPHDTNLLHVPVVHVVNREATWFTEYGIQVLELDAFPQPSCSWFAISRPMIGVTMHMIIQCIVIHRRYFLIELIVYNNTASAPSPHFHSIEGVQGKGFSKSIKAHCLVSFHVNYLAVLLCHCFSERIQLFHPITIGALSSLIVTLLLEQYLP
jgi:hypothetical protein